MASADPQGQPAVALQDPASQRDELVQASDGARGGGTEGFRRRASNEFFQSLAPYLDGFHRASPRHFFEERALPGGGFEKRHLDFREDDLQGESRKAGAAPDVQELSPKLRPADKEQAFAEVAGDAGLRVADCGQVDCPVPAQEEVEVGKQLRDLAGRERKAEGFKEFADSWLGEHALVILGRESRPKHMEHLKFQIGDLEAQTLEG